MNARASHGPVVISCEEYGHVDVDPAWLLTDTGDLSVDPDVHGRNAFTVDFVKGKMRLQASSLVGVIPLNEHVILKVRPRVPVSNLARMVSETGHKAETLRAFREYQGSGNARDWVMDLYADALLDHVDELLSRGLYRTYIRNQSEGSTPHGRIDFNRTVQRFASRGIHHNVAFHWHERTPDNPPNRCIKSALLAIRAHLTSNRHDAKGSRARVKRLAGQLAAFQDVWLDRTQAFMHDPEVRGAKTLPSTRDYYRDVLDVAILIVENRGIAIEPGGEDVRLPSLLIEMNGLFESYVRVSLQRQSTILNWPVEIVDGNSQGHRPLYERPVTLPTYMGSVMEPMFTKQPAKATPDLIGRMPSGDVVFVAEVKNTAKGGLLPERSEVNQAVTYAVRYGLDKVLLIRPLKEGSPGLMYCGQVGTVGVYDYKVELGATDLDAVAADFAAAVAALMPPEACSALRA